MLLSEGIISKGQLEEALARKKELGTFIGQTLVTLGYLKQEILIEFLVKQCKIPHIRLLDYEISQELFKLVPMDVCKQFNLLPIDKLGRILTLAMVDPLDVDALERVRSLCPELRIKPILCSWHDFELVAGRLLGIEDGGAEASASSFGLSTAAAKTGTKPQDSQAGGKPAAKTLSPETKPAGNAPAGTVRQTRHEPPPAQPAMAGETGSSTRDLAAAVCEGLRETMQEAMAGLVQQLRPGIGEDDAETPSEPKTRKQKHNPVTPLNASVADGATLPEDVVDLDAQVLAALHSESPLAGFTFDTYVVGKANKFTCELCKAVADHPGGDYNPFFLYGDVGVGKTHLVNAIGNAILAGKAQCRVGYVSSSLFADRLNHAAQEQAVDVFRENYCHWDVLILDDIQFLGGRTQAQEEFFHIFNLFTQAKRQIIIAADQPPDKLRQLQERLISRFAGGIVANLHPPEWDTRMAILEHLAKNSTVAVPKEVLSLVATRVPTDVRKMVGALRKIVAFATLLGQDISNDMASEVLSHLVVEEAA